MPPICDIASSALRGALDAGANSVSARPRLIVAGATAMLGGEALHRPAAADAVRILEGLEARAQTLATVPCILLSRRGLIRRNDE